MLGSYLKEKNTQHFLIKKSANAIDFDSNLINEKKNQMNKGGGGNLNSNFFSMKTHLKDPQSIVREQYFKKSC